MLLVIFFVSILFNVNSIYAETTLNNTEIQEEVNQLNALPYEHRRHIAGHKADFYFIMI